MEFRVWSLSLAASDENSVVKYDAEVEVTTGDGSAVVEVISTRPDDADPELLRHAVESIRRGAQLALRSRGLKAHLKLYRLVIHPVDCKPAKFESATAAALARVLKGET